MSEKDPPPVGSGHFATQVGAVFILSALLVIAFHIKTVRIPTAYILAGWLICSGIIAIVWGVKRIKRGLRGDMTIGMDTINMLVTMLAVAFAIAALDSGVDKCPTLEK